MGLEDLSFHKLLPHEGAIWVNISIATCGDFDTSKYC